MSSGASTNGYAEPEGLEVAQSTTSGQQDAFRKSLENVEKLEDRFRKNVEKLEELQKAIKKLEEEELPEATKNQEDRFRKSMEKVAKLEELQKAIKKLEEEVRVDLEDPVALATFLVTANIKLIRAEYLFHLVTEDRRLPRRQEAEGESFVDRAGKTRSALVDHTEVQAWAAGSKEAIIVSVSHAWEAREHPDPCGYQLEQVVSHASLFVTAFAADMWLFFDYVSLFQFKRETGTEEQSFRRSMGNMHAMYAHESTMTFRVESLTPEQRWQKAIQDGLQVKIFHAKSGLIQPVPLEDSENLKQNQNLYFDRGWCRAEMSWSSVRGDTAQNQRVDLEVAVTKEKKVTDAHLTGRTPVAPDAFEYDMNSAVFTHRSDAGAVIDLQKKNFLEKVTKRRKLKVEGVSLQQMQALTQSLRHFEQLKSITINDFRCGDNEARAFVEALATTPIKKISCKTGDQSSLDCLVKAIAVASKTLKITHLDLASEYVDWAQLGASGAKAIAVFLKSTTTLVNLDLSFNSLENEGAEVLAEALKENRTLNCLNLASNLIGVQGVQALQQALETNTTLEHLELDELSIMAAEAIAVACRANPRICQPSAVLSEACDGSEEQALKSPFEAAVRIKGLADELRLNRIIPWLYLIEQNICDEQLKALADAFRVNKTIEKVNLSSNQIGNDGVKALANAFRVNKAIKAVILNVNQIGDEGVKALADAFRVNKTIETVDLGNNQIGDEGMKALAEAFRVNKTIETVDLGNNQIGDEGMKALAEAFRVNKTIDEVHLWNNQIGDEGVKALALAMEINETITVVKLGMKEDQLAMLSDEGRQAVKDIQRFCDRNKIRGVFRSQSTTSADLSYRKLGDEEVKALADAFRVNKTIKEVDLRHNQIGNDGVKALADAIRVNNTINKVDLGYNQIGNDGVKALASAMEITETITEVGLDMWRDQLARLSDEGRQAVKDIQRFCDRNKEPKLEAAVRSSR